eukprot:TRINITY_DN23390_c0_g1_i1.p1 TRINITY_DN23390_c0_g1~~TRINITY_DN23390_c0_g1_i1.p1  ORF type:complete len:614 (+),score=69.81 TRINITY_DN23390_c0_g1_i1:63-1904(+)
MGAMLPKPVESTLMERHAGSGFHAGVAEVNGWRSSMEDAHLIHLRDDWAFFGVFDGHGGSECSSFVAKRLSDSLEKQGCPKDDAAVKKLMLDTDKAFLDTARGSGSTGAMCIVHRPVNNKGKFRLRVINAGDSRVLLGRRDGSIVDGGGTDEGLTIDHKPNNPSERQRIYRCGGHVEEAAGGVARVNGELAVSRGFGDAQYKRTGGPGPEERPVTANPELGHFECDETDFLMIVCDGVSEGEFPNADVVRFAAKLLRSGLDPASVAKAVCHKAIEANSKDNVTCMIILLNSPDKLVKHEFIPGPISAPNHKTFMDAYEAMAKRGGLTLAQAAERRYDLVQELLASPDTSAPQAVTLRQEAKSFGNPPGAKGSEERSAYFRTWQQKLPQQQAGGVEGGTSDPDVTLMRMLMSRPGGRNMLSMLGCGPKTERRVRAAEYAALKRSVESHPALKWDSRMASLAGAEGVVKEDDPSDGTSQVRFPAPLNIVAWLPIDALVDTSPSDGPARSEGPRALALPQEASPDPEPRSAARALPRLANSRGGLGIASRGEGSSEAKGRGSRTDSLTNRLQERGGIRGEPAARAGSASAAEGPVWRRGAHRGGLGVLQVSRAGSA